MCSCTPGRLDAEVLSVTRRVGELLQKLPRDINPVNLEELRRIKQTLVELENKVLFVFQVVPAFQIRRSSLVATLSAGSRYADPDPQVAAWVLCCCRLFRDPTPHVTCWFAQTQTIILWL
jgi:hypothetical protein